MGLSNNLISKFVKATKDEQESKKETTVYGTVRKDQNGDLRVQLDGSENILTPVKTTVVLSENDRVTVMIKNHTAIVTGNLTNPSASEGDTVRVSQLEAEKVRVNNLIAANAEIQGTLEAQDAVINSLDSTYASISYLNSNYLTANDIQTNYLSAEEIDAEYAKIDTLDSTYATITNLNSVKGDIQTLNSEIANIDTLIFGSATGNIIQTSFSNAVIAQLGDAQIKSAMIENVSADKITAGDIITNNVRVMSEDGSLIISDETLQISDSSRVRVQIGKDSSNDYSINIWDQNGNLMFSKGGITDSAIKEAIIRNDMVSDTANIHASKLDIDSLFEEINDSSHTIKSSRVYLDEESQTLDVAFKSLTTEITEQGEIISSQGTAISTIQGQISSKVWQQDINTATNTMSTQYSTLEQEVDGFKTTVNETYATKTELTNKINNIEIGGRNLLVNSNKEVGASATREFIQFADIAPIFDEYGLVEYTISFDIKSKDITNKNTIEVYCQNGSGARYNIGQKSVPVTTEYTRRYIVVTPSFENESMTESFLAFYGTYGSGNIPMVRNVKIEKGNKPTDWTSAPEDMETRMYSTESSITQLEDSITTTVSEVTDLGTRMTTMEQNAEGFTWSIDESAIVSTVNEYYQSTSTTELAGGSWSTTQPTWTQGKYIWFRTKNTNGKGTVSYSTAVCVTGNTGAKGDKGDNGNNGATGATGTGISSITREYYVSTSKTSQTGGSWSTTTPVWSSGKYIWIRDKIVYTNPSSTVYTTPMCDSSWEAVNEIEVGGRNYFRVSNTVDLGCTNNTLTSTGSCVGFYTTTEVGDIWSLSRENTGNNRFDYCFTVDKPTSGCAITGWNQSHRNDLKIEGIVTPEGCNYIFLYLSNQNDILPNIKLEKGNKATDWTPAPEDVETGINNAAKTATNYMDFSSSGLIIGDMTASTLGRNVLIDSDSVDIRNGETTLASFGEDYLYLAKNSRNAKIDLCNGLATMYHASKYSYDTVFVIDTGNTVEIQALITPLCLTSTYNQEQVKIQFAYTDDAGEPVVLGGVGIVGSYLRRYGSNMYDNYTILDKGNFDDVMDSGWSYVGVYGDNFTQYSNNEHDKCKCRKIGKIVEIRGAAKPTTNITGSSTQYTIFTLPEGYRPPYQIQQRCQGSGTNTWLLTIRPDGLVNFSRYGDGSNYVDIDTSAWLPFQATFFID